MSPGEAKDELGLVRDNSVQLEWHCSKFCNVTDDASDKHNECAARAYLLYLVGCTLFNDKSETRVSIEYLKLFKDLGQVSSYAWGAAALAYLYK